MMLERLEALEILKLLKALAVNIPLKLPKLGIKNKNI